MVDLLESGGFYPPLDPGVDARAAYNAVVAGDVCDPAGQASNYTASR